MHLRYSQLNFCIELQGSLLDTTGDLNSMAMGGVDRFAPLISAPLLSASKFEVSIKPLFIFFDLIASCTSQ
jgi:hypothetical protein